MDNKMEFTTFKDLELDDARKNIKGAKIGMGLLVCFLATVIMLAVTYPKYQLPVLFVILFVAIPLAVIFGIEYRRCLHIVKDHL